MSIEIRFCIVNVMAVCGGEAAKLKDTLVLNVMARMQMIELERRTGNQSRVEQLYGEASRAITSTRERSWLAIRFARFLFKVSDGVIAIGYVGNVGLELSMNICIRIRVKKTWYWYVPLHLTLPFPHTCLSFPYIV